MEANYVLQRKSRDSFASMQVDGPSTFKPVWIDYEHFEDLISRCVIPVKGGTVDEATSDESVRGVRAQFFLELADFLQTFFTQYMSHKQYILKKKRGSAWQRAVANAMKKLSTLTFLDLDDVVRRKEVARMERSEVTQEAAMFRAYAETHAAAIRELLQHFDDYTKTRAGAEFLSDMQSRKDARFDALMQMSTFLMELRALESTRRERASACRSAERSGPEEAPGGPHDLPTTARASWLKRFSCLPEPHSGHVHPANRDSHSRLERDSGAPSTSSSGPPATLPSCDISEDDLQCAICLDLMHNPVSLGCGHCFCAACVLAEARRVGGGGAAPDRVTKIGDAVRCPLCRRDGVCRGAMTLDALDRLIRQRYPKRWKKQRAYLQQLREERACARVESGRWSVHKFMAAISTMNVIEQDR